MLKRDGQRGDTIIEVLLAIAVFSLVSVGVMTIMNQSTNVAQRALEITLVRQQIDAQAEALRAAHQAYGTLTTKEARDNSQWKLIRGTLRSSPVDTSGGCPVTAELTSVFIMNYTSGSYSTSVDSIATADLPYAQVSPASMTGYGIWIEGDKVTSINGNVPGAYNFRIRACWYGAGMGDTPMEIETIVRLYDVA